MYCTPKIHKPGAPLRPIVDYTGSTGYNTSKALAEILAPMLGTTEHHIKNSRDLAELMKDFTIAEDEEFVSHDVVTIFTSMPIPEMLECIKNEFTKDVTLKDHTNLDADDIMELLEFICNTTYFIFDGTIMQQKFGTAMGSPVSAAVANFYMEKLEQKALSTAPVNCKSRLWKRYVDDMLEAIKKDQIAGFTDHLNAVDETGSIKFTYKEESNGTIPFLDLLFRRQPNGAVSTKVYWKRTQADQYLHFRSHHPISHKTGVVRTLMDRKDTLVSTENDKNKEELHIRTALYQIRSLTRMWANAQPDGRPAKHRWRPLFNAAKFG